MHVMMDNKAMKNYKDYIEKICLLKHQLELGALLDSLHQHKVIEYMLNNEPINIFTLSNTLNLPIGYIAMCLKTLWINSFFDDDSSLKNIRLSDYGREYMQNKALYLDFQQNIQQALDFLRIKENTEQDIKQYLLDNENCLKSMSFQIIHLALLSEKLIANTALSIQNKEYLRQRLLSQLFPDADEASMLSGKLFLTLCSMVLLTVSYMPAYANVIKAIQYTNDIKNHTEEPYVDRTTDIEISGEVFQGYVADIFFRHIKQLFNSPIFLLQPKYIVDLGCGNGDVLIKTYEYIANNTLRGDMLEEYPLILVGVDYNKIPVETTKQHLKELNVPHEVIYGDIDSPQTIWDKLSRLGLKPEECLHISKSTIHNKTYTGNCISPNEAIESFYTYRDTNLNILNPELVAQDLQNHLKRWQPYIGKFGYLIIEAHNGLDEGFTPYTLNVIEKSSMTTLNLSHDLSGQYLVDAKTFEHALVKSGYKLVSNFPLQKTAGNTCLALYYVVCAEE